MSNFTILDKIWIISTKVCLKSDFSVPGLQLVESRDRILKKRRWNLPGLTYRNLKLIVLKWQGHFRKRLKIEHDLFFSEAFLTNSLVLNLRRWSVTCTSALRTITSRPSSWPSLSWVRRRSSPSATSTVRSRPGQWRRSDPPPIPRRSGSLVSVTSEWPLRVWRTRLVTPGSIESCEGRPDSSQPSPQWRTGSSRRSSGRTSRARTS